MLKVGTTFSGIGSPEQALKNLGIPHVVKWACDIDKYAKETYFANHSCEKWYRDITTINAEELEYVDLYIWGFPCTDVSFAGKQDLNKGRTTLAEYSLNIIDKILPKYIIFENVKGLLAKKFSSFYQSIVERIGVNYNYQLVQINSKDLGIPHYRERVFGIGIRKDLEYKNIEIQKSPERHFKEFLESDVDQKYFVSEERRKRIIEVAFREQAGFELKNEYGEIKQANKNTLFGDKKIRYSGYIYCQNLIDRHGFIYPDKETIRLFTPRECARLQGFPDDFIIHPKDPVTYRQMGNTITVNAIQEVLRNLLIPNGLSSS